MTKKLFYDDSYVKEFEAKVVEIDENKVVLDQTAFYPTGGGQVADTGEINGIRVVDTRKIVEKKIVTEQNQPFKNEKPVGSKVIHVLEKEPDFKAGDTVQGKIDWDRRYKIMRLHTAAHLTYYVALDVFKFTRVKGSYVDDKKDRLDFTYEGRLDPEKLKQVEEKVNELIAKNIEINRFKDPKNPELLCWEVDGYPMMHCGGTHVKNTKEIGRIRLKRVNPGSNLERIETYLVE